MNEIRWAPRAAKDLEEIFEYIRRDNPPAAEQVVRIIYEGCAALRTFPNRGCPGRIKGRRELVFAPLPYVAVYRVIGTTVEISRIYHGARRRT